MKKTTGNRLVAVGEVIGILSIVGLVFAALMGW